MDNAIQTARQRFTLLTIAVAVLCAILSVAGSYIYSRAQINNRINADRLSELSISNPALSKYLESQKEYNAHFDSMAAIIQQEDQDRLYQALPVVFGSVFLLSAGIGWLLARKLLQPVNEAYYIQRRFMQDAAHELRNPLAAMKSLIQRAGNRKIQDKELVTMIHSLNRQVNNLSDITTDLLLLERKELVGKNPVDIVGLLHDVIEQLHQEALHRKVKIRVDAPEKLEVPINPQHFVYITKNIIENAIKFSTRPRQTVEVYLAKKQQGWILKVKDNGIGISGDDLRLLSQRFYRGSNTAGIDGTGLGLSIVSKYVALYKGKLRITSHINKGTTVSVTM
jgi:signal transduction histidine kinase